MRNWFSRELPRPLPYLLVTSRSMPSVASKLRKLGERLLALGPSGMMYEGAPVGEAAGTKLAWLSMVFEDEAEEVIADAEVDG